MAKFKNLEGKILGNLTIIKYLGNREYLCECSCFVRQIFKSSILQHSTRHPISCSNCARLRETARKKNSKSSLGRKSSREIDITGNKYGKLLVLGKSQKRTNNNRPLWDCICFCGNLTSCRSHDLRSGKISGCGCGSLGENNHNWRGGTTKLEGYIRTLPQYQKWRSGVYKRDRYTCQMCFSQGKSNLHAHHIIYFSSILKNNHVTTLDDAKFCKDLWDIGNGITLCDDCHRYTHKRAKKEKVPYANVMNYILESIMSLEGVTTEVISRFNVCKSVHQMKLMHQKLVAEGVFIKDQSLIENVKQETGVDLGEIIKLKAVEKPAPLPANFNRNR